MWMPVVTVTLKAAPMSVPFALQDAYSVLVIPLVPNVSMVPILLLGFYLSDNQCVACTNNCETCSSQSHCLSCEENYNLYLNECITCDDHCTTCDPSNASTCFSCEDGFFLDTNTCVTCNSPCATCGDSFLFKSDADDCTSCIQSHYLIDS